MIGQTLRLIWLVTAFCILEKPLPPKAARIPAAEHEVGLSLSLLWVVQNIEVGRKAFSSPEGSGFPDSHYSVELLVRVSIKLDPERLQVLFPVTRLGLRSVNGHELGRKANVTRFSSLVAPETPHLERLGWMGLGHVAWRLSGNTKIPPARHKRKLNSRSFHISHLISNFFSIHQVF